MKYLNRACAAAGYIFVLTYCAPAAADYESAGLRDPFVPLADEHGLRSDIFQSGAAGELPINLQIMGILSSGGSAMAIINGEVVKEGDLIDSVKVEKIDDISVTVSYENKIYKLMLRKEEEGR